MAQREIKFRFWLGHIKKMTYDHTLESIPGIIKEFTPDIVPLQFTCKKDKNGKDIFEGDIVRILNESTATKKEYWYPVFEVNFEGLGFGLKHIGGGKEGDNHMFIFRHYSKDMEVIGNIYENPELI